ncbi:MAG: hypothetical protein DRN18_01870 [Thermoplasmata archaeon]|nr:MAG: hypothetical protein DRN18_01870 [Thermoplasmata archaeon]
MGRKIRIKETPHVTLLVEQELEEPILIRLISKPDSGKPVFSKPFLVDIVKLDYFEKFLENFDGK